jgi:DNA-binding MarR family transcriptional regulator
LLRKGKSEVTEELGLGYEGTPDRFQAMMRAANWDPRASEPILALLQADTRVAGALERAVAPSGLTLPKFNVLIELAQTPGGRLPLHEIRRRLVTSAPNVTSLVDRLEADGLLKRIRETTDRRVVMAQITERAWKKLAVATPALLATEQRLLRDLSVADRSSLANLLRRVGPRVQDG